MTKSIAKSKRRVRTILGYVISAFAVPVLGVLKVGLRLQVGYFYSSRLGHFAPDVAWYLATREMEDAQRVQKKSRRCFHIFFLESDVCNEFFEHMVRRTIVAKRVSMRWYKFLTTAPVLNEVWLLPARKTNRSRDPDGRVYRAEKILSFSSEENLAGRRYLH